MTNNPNSKRHTKISLLPDWRGEINTTSGCVHEPSSRRLRMRPNACHRERPSTPAAVHISLGDGGRGGVIGVRSDARGGALHGFQPCSRFSSCAVGRMWWRERRRRFVALPSWTATSRLKAGNRIPSFQASTWTLQSGRSAMEATARCSMDMTGGKGLPKQGLDWTAVAYFKETAAEAWPGLTRSGSYSAWSPRRCRPCSTSGEAIEVVVDMTASV